MATKKKTIHQFEKSIESLEQLVQNLENGDLSLEESLKQFEKGVRLAKECQIALSEAEQKVLLLTEEQEGVFTLSEFDGEE